MKKTTYISKTLVTVIVMIVAIVCVSIHMFDNRITAFDEGTYTRVVYSNGTWKAYDTVTTSVDYEYRVSSEQVKDFIENAVLKANGDVKITARANGMDLIVHVEGSKFSDSQYFKARFIDLILNPYAFDVRDAIRDVSSATQV